MMQILYFDNHLVVANKEAGIATEASQGPSLEALVCEWVKKQYQKKGEAFLRAAHRLDKPASGIVIFAKTSKALVRLQEAFRERRMQKTYVACVEGRMEKQGMLEDYLVHGEHRAVISHSADPLAKLARLSYVTREDSLLEIALHTGRYHQIRIQLASRGCPIVNDGRYGAVKRGESESIALHHYRIVLQHPVSKEELCFCVEPPKAWKERGWWKELSSPGTLELT